MRESKIQYNPSLTVKENAKKNCVTEAAIRYYIRVNALDRSFDRKQNIIANCRKYLSEHPKATRDEICEKTGHSLSTIRKYWEYISTENELTDFDEAKAKKRQELEEVELQRQMTLLSKIPVSVIEQYLANYYNEPITAKATKNNEAASTSSKKKVSEQPVITEVEVPLTDEDTDPAQIKLRQAATLIRKATQRDSDTILDGVSIKYEEQSYPVDDVILYSSKVEPENRMLGHHYECIILFRGIEFYGVEQLHSALKFNEHPYILNDIMAASSGVDAKKRSHKYDLKHLCLYDSDYNKKDRRITALCFLFKYLSVPEFRNRLRELEGKILYENKGEYEGGNRMDESKTHFIGCNSDGRSMMAVRDMMLRLEREAISEAEDKKGDLLTEKETETVLAKVLDDVRAKFENDEQVKADTDNVVEYIMSHKDIIPLKRPWTDSKSRLLLLEFDNCVFDTSVDDEVRKAKGAKITSWSKFFKEYIPQYKLYDGWKDVFEWAEDNNILIGVLGKAKAELVRRAFAHNGLRIDAADYISKAEYTNGYPIMDSLKVRPSQVIYVGSSELARKQAEKSQVRFINALWGDNASVELSDGETLSKPQELIDVLEKGTK